MAVASEKALCLLSFDGGGVRGLASLLILKRIMYVLDDRIDPEVSRPLLPCQYFDMMAGTSTGGLIAIMLGVLRMDIDECINKYLEMAPKIFPTEGFLSGSYLGKILQGARGVARFDAQNLEFVVKEMVSEKLKSGQDTPLDSVARPKDAGECCTFVCVTNKDTGKASRLRSYRSSSEPSTDCTVWQAARATSAAPLYFAPIQLGKPPRNYVDGGLILNNPVRALYDEANRVWGKKSRGIGCIISIGTGVPALMSTGNTGKSIIESLASIAMETEQTAHDFADEIKTSHGTDAYFRFNVEQGLQTVGLEEWKDFGALCGATDYYLETRKSEIDGCVNAILNLRVSPGEQDNFRSLDSTIRSVAVGLAKEGKNSEELSKLVRLEQASTKTYIAEELRQHRVDQAEREYRRKFLEALYFPEMYVRQETIAEAHSQTFQWIFDASGEKVRPWTNFVGWLESGHGIYWINGKAGSGKSTLMSYVSQDNRVTSLLHSWSDPKQIIIPTFFFWNAGSPMQKTTIGLLRSLLYQILDKHPHLTLPLAQATLIGEQRYPPIPAWTEKRLLLTLSHLIRLLSSSSYICFFIDGLDEYEGSKDAILALIKDFVQYKNVKICLSSRPDKSFGEAFQSSPMLRLQDLTKRDIKAYVKAKLEQIPIKNFVSPTNAEYLSRVSTEIQNRAEGVFLWVEFAVRSQIEGLRNEDSPEELAKSLRLLPDEIEDIYADMLDKIPKAYRPKIACYLHILMGVSGWESNSLFDIALAFNRYAEDILDSSSFSLEDLRSHCALTGRRLLATCPALLEINTFNIGYLNPIFSPTDGDIKHAAWVKCYLSTAQGPINAAEAIYGYKYWTVVQFIHRSAKEFMQENGVGRAFLQANTPPDFSRNASMVNLKLVDVVMFPPLRDNFFRPSTLLTSTGAILPRSEEPIADSMVVRGLGNTVMSTMHWAQCLEQETKRAHVPLIHKIDHVVAMICAQYGYHDPSSHWCLQLDFGVSSPECLRDFWIAETARLSKGWIVGDGPVEYSLSKPVDLLSLAAYCHLDLYVQHVLTSQPDLNDPIALGRLLFNFLFAESWVYVANYFPNIRLIAMLFNRGANPNTVYNHASIWQLFLYRMGRDLSSPLIDSNTVRARAHSWGACINAFLENGADVNDTIQFDSPQPFLDIINPEHRSELRELGKCDLVVYQSVLSFLQQFHHVLPEFPQIQAVCLARGARLESTPRGFYNQFLENRLVLSESESNELSKSLKTHYPNRCVSGTPEAMEVSRVLADIYYSRPEPRLTQDPRNRRDFELERWNDG